MIGPQYIAERRAETLAAKMAPYIEAVEAKSVLDVGPGSGRVALWLARLTGIEVHMVDVKNRIAPDVKRQIKEDQKVHIAGPDIYDHKSQEEKQNKKRGRARRLPYDDDQFDVVIGAFVLHHASFRGHLINQIGRVSKKRALIVDDTPLTSEEMWFWQLWDRHLNHRDHRHPEARAPSHRPFTAPEWREQFVNCGLQVVDEQGIRGLFLAANLFPHTLFVLEHNPPTAQQMPGATGPGTDLSPPQ